MLYGSGYDVTEADSGVQALLLYEQGHRFDVVITDIAMPGGIDGIDLAEAVRQIDSKARIIFISGYAGVDWTILEELNASFIGKPFRRKELLDHLRLKLQGSQ
jgi:CheY-like chemotaxis protein